MPRPNLPGTPRPKKVQTSYNKAGRLNPGGSGPSWLSQTLSTGQPHLGGTDVTPQKGKGTGYISLPCPVQSVGIREHCRPRPGLTPFSWLSPGEPSRDLPCAARPWQARDSSPGCKTLDGHQHLGQRGRPQEARQSASRGEKGGENVYCLLQKVLFRIPVSIPPT